MENTNRTAQNFLPRGKTKAQLIVSTSRGLGRYAARLKVTGVGLATAIEKATELYPELDAAQFGDAWADERNDLRHGMVAV